MLLPCLVIDWRSYGCQNVGWPSATPRQEPIAFLTCDWCSPKAGAAS